MAKISIDDRTDKNKEGKVQLLATHNRIKIYDAVIYALENLGSGERIVEVIKITPLHTNDGSRLTNFIRIKIVVSMTYARQPKFEHPISLNVASSSIREEHSFEIFFKENGRAFLCKRLREEFLQIIDWKIEEMKDFTNQLASIEQELRTRVATEQ